MVRPHPDLHFGHCRGEVENIKGPFHFFFLKKRQKELLEGSAVAPGKFPESFGPPQAVAERSAPYKPCAAEYLPRGAPLANMEEQTSETKQ